MKTKILALLVVMLGTGCATGYGPDGWSGGYYDRKVGKNKYLVGFNGNGYTSTKTAQGYAFQRAEELCQEQGFSNFELLSKNDSASTSRTPSQMTCSQGYGRTATCSESGGNLISKPESELLISCTNE